VSFLSCRWKSAPFLVAVSNTVRVMGEEMMSQGATRMGIRSNRIPLRDEELFLA